MEFSFSEDQTAIIEAVKEFADEDLAPKAKETDEAHAWPGENVRKLKDLMKKSIEVVGFSRNLESFLRSIFHNYKVTGVKVEEKDNVSYARVAVDPSQKGRAIGKGGSNLRQAKEIVNRYFDRTEITIE